MKRKQKIIFFSIFVLIILLVIAIILINSTQSHQPTKPNISLNTVTRIIDGDTLVLASEETIRLICVGAPEINTQQGKEAQQFLEQIILNKPLRIEKDISETDQYNRSLRYVWVNNSLNEEIFVNKELVQQGYAQVWRYGNDTKRCDEIEGNII